MRERSRKTRQRDALQQVLAESERPLSVGEILQTVYRAIGAMLEDGAVEAVEIPGEPTRYERTDKGHHHHFRCEKCDRVLDVAGCLDNLRKLTPPRFRLKDHAVTLYGLCAGCAR